jgi:hypothetical protein
LRRPIVFPIRRTERPRTTGAVRAGLLLHRHLHALSRGRLQGGPRGGERRAVGGPRRSSRATRSSTSSAGPPATTPSATPTAASATSATGRSPRSTSRTRARWPILDVDYHHGNGSPGHLLHRADVLTDLHPRPPELRLPYFSGFADEKGEGDGLGFNHNLPLAEEVHDGRYLEALDEALGIVRRFKPEALVVSLGLDIAKADPTGTWSVTPDGLYEVGRRIGSLRYPTLLVQEGGYNIRFLGRNAARLLEGFCAGALGRKATT